MSIESAVKKYAAFFQSSHQSSGNFSFREHGSRDVIKLPPLPHDLFVFYEVADISDSPIYGGDAYLQWFEPDQLPQAHQGWKYDKNGVRIKSWKDEWIIFAERNGDVIFFDGESSSIFGSTQHRNIKISSTLEIFIENLIICGKIEEDIYSCDTRIDDMSMKKEVLDQIRKALHDKFSNGFMKFFFE